MRENFLKLKVTKREILKDYVTKINKTNHNYKVIPVLIITFCHANRCLLVAVKTKK